MCDVRPDEFSALGHNRAVSRVQHRVIRLKREERAKGGDVRSEVFEDGGALAEDAEDGVGGIEGAVGGDVEADGVGGVPRGVDDLHWGRTVGYGKELAVCEVVEEGTVSGGGVCPRGQACDSRIRVCIGWHREFVDAGRLEWSGGVPLVPHSSEE